MYNSLLIDSAIEGLIDLLYDMAKWIGLALLVLFFVRGYLAYRNEGMI